MHSIHPTGEVAVVSGSGRGPEGSGLPGDRAAPVPFPVFEGTHGVTCQALRTGVGIGGDRATLRSRPRGIRTAYADGGRTPQTLAGVRRTAVGAESETVGVPVPRTPGA